MTMALPAFIPRKLTFGDQEVAKLLGVSLRTAKRYKAEGRFGALAPKGRYARVTYTGLAKYLQGQPSER
ncbi:MAG: DUF3853 family protein [Desulfarculus sp.]|nr:DUF3853 family protein [Desulfarculus sp.]